MPSAKILVVEKEKISSDIKKMLLELSYTVTGIAVSSEEAIRKSDEMRPELILMDIKLEGSADGIETARKLKELYNIPVVYITGSEDEKIFHSARTTAQWGYIVKPFDKTSLHNTIELALYRYEEEKKGRDYEQNKYRLNIETIFRNVEDAIISVDRDLNITEFNPSAMTFFGLASEDKGKPFYNLAEICGCNKCVDIMKDIIINRETAKEIHIECNRNPMEKKILSFTATPLTDSMGIFCGTVMVIRDEALATFPEEGFDEKLSFCNIIGTCKYMQDIYSLIETLADTETTVLITGDSGTGKELVAEAIHYRGARRNKPLVKVNCSALSPSLLESELFGHVKGAFTGALKDKVGRFQQANRGTIFLDEIGDISPSIQIALLRFLQEKEFERVGDINTIKVDVRVIGATNQDLMKKVNDGFFRKDLYYRLKVVEIRLPLLRERKEDIPLLVDFFIRKFNKKLNKYITGITSDVQKIFLHYSWPGNIRELEHVIEHSFILCKNSIITLENLPVEFRNMPREKDIFEKFPVPEDAVHFFKGVDEKQLLIETLNRTRWNKTMTARFLGISRQTLYRRMKEYNL